MLFLTDWTVHYEPLILRNWWTCSSAPESIFTVSGIWT